jgi:hypothetical protein
VQNKKQSNYYGWPIKVLSKSAILLRKNRSRIPEKEIELELRRGIDESADRLAKYQKNIDDLFYSTINDSRVLCVSEANENIVMWSHYSDSHTGVCIRLQCIDELDNTLLIAKPVNYDTAFPVFPSLDDHIQHLTGERPISFADLKSKLPYVKHEDWGYEKEWRVCVPHEDPENQNGYNDWAENPRVFGAIYLGC